MSSHPIQLFYIGVKRFEGLSHGIPEPTLKVELTGKTKPVYSTALGNYDEAEKAIMVFHNCDIGDKNPEANTPVYIGITLGAFFKVINSESFGKKETLHFAENYSHFIVYPFLREQIYSISVRLGIQPIILPTIQVPMFKREDMVEIPEKENE